MSNIVLKAKLVGKISGDFIIPAYQRGYRWQEEVDMLLNDLHQIPANENYCLQPIVVKKLGDNKYELIDGQQRLTTLFLLLSYIKTYRPKLVVNYTMDYIIRERSREFLNNIDFDNIDDQASNIDEYFIKQASIRIRDWFANTGDEDNIASQIADKLNNHVSVIWYEIDNTDDAVSLFTRLNIGKIPLTNAELVRALFLSKNNGIDERYQLEISTQWDAIEKELHNNRLWYFITNKKAENYPTRIELLFDIMADKKESDRERLRTFFWFFDKTNFFSGNKIELWKDVIANFQRLKEWYSDSELYHKIGYLIAVGETSLQDLIKDSAAITKDAFFASLDKKIANSINYREDYDELSYDKHYWQIERLLLLFNVESVRQNGDKTMRFPFDKHKNKKDGWSLEHIHAQQSQGLNTQLQWNEWLDLHVKSLKNILGNSQAILINEIELRDRNNVTKEQFEDLFEKVITAFGFETNLEYLHTIGNMALLGKTNNSALNNSTFDVKRDKIIEMDRTGDYIPICTRRVFLKYYSSSENNQLHFWSTEDRKAYLKAMNNTLGQYLSIINKEIK
ncbi:MAG: DUF262 domain-containing protein [Bacteroidales bacterium]|nr:DUF262 domain-containing protein [Bacteroidales bacterium]